MYDMHYDLLTILYFNLKPNSKLKDTNKLINDCKKMYQNNIKGGIINLYFMPENEMEEELGISKEELESVPTMLKKSIEYLDYFKQINIIPSNIDFIYSIEGCDYIKDPEELEELYKLGLRSIIPVWNAKNKYGSGNRTNTGLTPLGIKLIKKAIELGIVIDLSHANKKTFNDILDVVEKEQQVGQNPIVIASHSNVKALCNKDRNLADPELIRLKKIGGYIGLFTNGKFLTSNYKQLNYQEKKQEYIKHLDYIINKIGFDIKKIIISTDDMNFHPDSIYHNYEAFPINTISKDIYLLITKNFNKEIATNILINNPLSIINKVK